MPLGRSPVSASRRRARFSGRVSLSIAAAVVIVLSAGAGGTTGAWFTATASRDGSLASSSISSVTGTAAGTRLQGVNVTWNSALSQTWATANQITTDPVYTVTRSIDGGSPTTVYTGRATTAADPFPHAALSLGHSTISSGQGVSGAISGGKVYTWGKDAGGYGQLGTGSSAAATPTAVTISGSRQITDLSMGSTGAVALASDNTVWAWGSKISTDCSTASTRPMQITVPSGVTITSVSVLPDCGSILLSSDGRLFTYLGNGFDTASLPGGRKIKQISKGFCVLATDGTVWCRGSNNHGQLGNGSTASSSSDFVQVPLRSDLQASQIASNGSTVAVVLSNNAVWGWGDNSSGQLGNGSTGSTVNTPVQFKGEGALDFIKVAVGGSHISALARDGSVSSAGQNSSGQLGNGTTTSSTTPVIATRNNVPAFSDITDGASQTYGVTSSGAVWGWGTNLVNGSPTLGVNDTSNNVWTSPRSAATNLTVDDGSNRLTCSNGATPNKAAYCAPSGTITYSVTYAYYGWKAAAAETDASSSATQTGSLVFGAPGSTTLCLGPQNGASARGTAVVLATCDSSPSQKWSAWSDGTFRSGGMCLDADGSVPGSKVQLWDCNGLGFQWWTVRDDGTVYNPNSGLCLTDPAGSAEAGTRQIIDTCNGSWTQKWSF